MCLVLGVVAAVCQGAVARAESMQIRLAFGGGADRLWQGTVEVSQGTVTRLVPLGVEADEPGSMWLEPFVGPTDPAGLPPGFPQISRQRLVIRQRSPRAYDGVDLLLDAPLEAKLVVQLYAEDSLEPTRVELPLTQLLGEFHSTDLDSQGNRLLIRRTPGDKLRVALQRDSLLFTPGEVFRFTVQPHLLSLGANRTVQVEARLVDAEAGHELWSAEHEIQADQPAAIPLEVALPVEVGVYDVVLTASYTPGWQEAVRRPLRWKETVAERKIQLMVLGGQPDVPPADAPSDLRQVVEIDPANPGWGDRLAKLPQLPKIRRLWKGPLGNGCSTIRQHSLGKLVELNPSATSPDLSWEAYTLPIKDPGMPHVLEVDYPSDVSQTLGISILEPNAAGALMPMGVDSGVDVQAELAGWDGAVEWRTHRIVFWPRTTSPLVLMTNRRQRSPAMYGQIRVLAGWRHLPKALPVAPRQSAERMLAAYLDRPLFPKNFSARESFDQWSRRSLDDWQTFYDAGRRLTEYLEYTGYNGLIMSMVADGSTLYPSEILQPTPRYDTGAFFASAQDPIRKNVLEMLLRLFDREQLHLVPAIGFDAPLPELEAALRTASAGSESLEWIGPSGLTWRQSRPAWRGLAPYYNVLDPRVQEAMLRVVREVALRCGPHRSFSGLAVRLSARGYAQLPGPEWGMDDLTIARFERDSGVKVPGEGPDRFAARAEFLAAEPYRRTWLQWRAAELSKFYHRMRSELAEIRPDVRLYLTGAEMLAGQQWEQDLRPRLPQRATLGETLLQAGFDARLYHDDPNLVLLRTDQVVTSGHLGSQATSLELRQAPDADRYFQGSATPGTLFFHPPQEARIASFDEKSPFQPSYAWLMTQPVPSGEQNRQRFVHAMATLDPHVMVDGGWMLPLGQEDSIRELVQAYRRLPAVSFSKVSQAEGVEASQPVSFRQATYEGRTYVYVVNDAPFRTLARVHVDAPPGCQLTELSGIRSVPPLRPEPGGGASWEVELKPYDLLAFQLSAPGARLSRVQVSLPGAVEMVLGRRIRELGTRAAILRNPPPMNALANPGFEQVDGQADSLPGWFTNNRTGVSIQADTTQRYSGSRCVKISSAGPIACLVSEPFDAPATGRLYMLARLRVANPVEQPPLRLAIRGKLNGKDYHRFACFGAAGPGREEAVPIETQWEGYVLRVDDLPLSGLTQLEVRFDLMGPGEVWVDDVQLFDLAFNDLEMKGFLKLIWLAQVTLEKGQVADCMRLLEGYWPRFLEENVPLGPSVAQADQSKPSPPQPTQPSQRTGILDRMKRLWPKQLRF